MENVKDLQKEIRSLKLTEMRLQKDLETERLRRSVMERPMPIETDLERRLANLRENLRRLERRLQKRTGKPKG